MIPGSEGEPQVVQVTVDGRPVTLPADVQPTLGGLCSYLEQLALQQERVLISIRVDGVAASSIGSVDASIRPRWLDVTTASLAEFSYDLMGLAHEQCEVLSRRVRDTALRVLINEWPIAERLWGELVPDLRSPLTVISFCEEIRLRHAREAGPRRSGLRAHLREFSGLWRRLTQCFERKDSEKFFDMLDQELAPWYDQLAKLLRSKHSTGRRYVR